MKKNKGISVIIPCYNVENYIENCLNLLIKQLEKFDYEIILVDDCSKDNTKKIIEDYLKEHKENIIFLKNEVNKGAGHSRNKAIKVAKYDLISFIDADDTIDDNYYEIMLEEIKDNDLIVCDIESVFENNPSNNILHKGCNGKINKYNILDQGLAASPCNKIIRKDLLLKYPFAEGIMNEDIPCILSIIANASKLGYTDKTKYNYIQREKSVQNSPLSDKKLDIIKALNIFSERTEKLKDYDKIIEIVVFHQLIEFFLYVPAKEKNTFKRSRFLKKFHKNTKKYNLSKNSLLQDFYNNLSKKSKLYYKTLFWLNEKGFSFIISTILTLYNIYRDITHSKTYVKKDITVFDIVELAKKQSKIKEDISVSVVIPNYNYENFLLQRIYSVLYQTKKINELIILDDCSKDNSRKLIDEIVEKTNQHINVKKVYNEENSGCVFKQWQKGFELASSEFVWIAEADDYCEKNFLSEQFKLLKKDKNIVLSYVDTAFIDKEGHKILKTVKNEIDILKSRHWDKSYIISGKEELINYSYLNCTIANVSSVLFKRDNYDDIFKKATNYKQVGDWRFYLGVYEKGKVAFVNKTLNYYRVHGNNVTSTTKKQNHFDEIRKLHKELSETYKFTKIQKQNINERYEFLKRVWKIEIK